MAIGNQTKWREDALSLIRTAGYYELTPYQQKVVPLILKGRDVVFEYSVQRGKTVALILPLLMRVKHDSQGIKAIVLAAGTPEVDEIFTGFRRFQPPAGRSRQRSLSGFVTTSGSEGLVIVRLTEEQDIRAEVRAVSRNPDIVVTTPARLIDHIRRENTAFADQVDVLVYAQGMDAQGIDSGFHKDLQYIYSKLPTVRQSVVFSPIVDAGAQQPWSILRRPKVFRESGVFQSLKRVRHFVYEVDEEGKDELLLDLIVSRNLGPLLVYCDTEEKAAGVAAFLAGRKLSAAKLTRERGGEPTGGGQDILVTSDRFMESMLFPEIGDVVNFDPPRDSDHYVKRCAPLSAELRQIHTFRSRSQSFDPNHLQETLKVTVTKQDGLSEEEVVKGNIQRIIKIINEEEDPEELNRFKRLVKRNVPIFLRSDFMAYLFKQSLGKIERKPEAFTTLFISVGKNRKVFPRDLINLFMKNLKVGRDDFGDIKVFDNYSFMDISLDHASEAISRLSGISFRGRRITVSRARKRDNSKG